MRRSFSLVNVYTKLQTFTRNVAANNDTQVVLSHNNGIIVSNSHTLPVTSARQPSVKRVHPIIA